MGATTFVRITLLLVWVLLLSWITHFAASPGWRAPKELAEIISTSQALDPAKWSVKDGFTALQISPTGEITIDRLQGWRAVAVQKIELPPNLSLLRLQATLKVISLSSQEITLYPKPVLHVLTRGPSGGRYPYVARPMFFESTIRICVLPTLQSSLTMHTACAHSLVCGA